MPFEISLPDSSFEERPTSLPLPKSVKQPGKLGERSVFQWCKDHPQTILAVFLITMVAAAVFASAPYLVVFALAAAFSAPVVLPSLTLAAAVGGAGGALAATIVTSAAFAFHKLPPTLKQKEAQIKERKQAIEDKSNQAAHELATKRGSLGFSLLRIEDELDKHPQIETLWKHLEQAEVDEKNGNPNADAKQKRAALEQKISELQIEEITNLWTQRVDCKNQIEEIEQQIKEVQLDRIKKLQELRDSYATFPGHDSEKIQKLNAYLKTLMQ